MLSQVALYTHAQQRFIRVNMNIADAVTRWNWLRLAFFKCWNDNGNCDDGACAAARSSLVFNDLTNLSTFSQWCRHVIISYAPLRDVPTYVSDSSGNGNDHFDIIYSTNELIWINTTTNLRTRHWPVFFFIRIATAAAAITTTTKRHYYYNIHNKFFLLSARIMKWGRWRPN